MPRWLLPVGLLALGLATVAWFQQVQSRSRSGFVAPDFELPDLRGNMHRLSALRGKVVFLNLWTTWCPPCRTEMPSMQRLYNRFQSREFAMLAVSQDEDGAAAVAPFVRELGLSFPVLLDREGRVSGRYGVTGYPETFIIDRRGQVVNHIIGPADWASDELVAYFQRLIDQPVSDADAVQAAAP
jgi:peroxiredoxin